MFGPNNCVSQISKISTSSAHLGVTSYAACAQPEKYQTGREISKIESHDFAAKLSSRRELVAIDILRLTMSFQGLAGVCTFSSVITL